MSIRQLTRNELIEKVWGERYETGNKGLYQAIWQLRKALEELEQTPSVQIERIAKQGYQLNGQIKLHWRHVRDKNPLPVTFNCHLRHLEVNQKVLELTPQQGKIVEAIIDAGSATISLQDLVKQLELPKSQLLSAVLTLQYDLTQLDDNARFFESLENNQLRFATLTQPNTADLVVKHYPVQQVVGRFSVKSVINHVAAVSFIANIILLILLFHKSESKHFVQTDTIFLNFLEQVAKINNDENKIEYFTMLDLANSVSSQEYLLNSSLGALNAKLAIANQNSTLQRYDIAEEQLLKVLVAYEALEPNTSFSQELYLKTVNELSRLYLAKTQFAQAAEYIRLAEAAETHLLTKNTVIIQYLANKVSYLLQVGEFKQVNELVASHEGVLHQAEKAAIHSLLIVYNANAVAYRQLGDIDSAITILEKALQIESKVFGAEHSTTANRLANLASVYLFKGAI